MPAGPSGTYSHHAAITFFGNQGAQAEGPVAAGQWLEGRVAGFTALPERTVDAVFKTVVANQAQFGVVPIENSHTGISATTRDLLVQVRPLTPLTALLDIVLWLVLHVTLLPSLTT